MDGVAPPRVPSPDIARMYVSSIHRARNIAGTSRPITGTHRRSAARSGRKVYRRQRSEPVSVAMTSCGDRSASPVCVVTARTVSDSDTDTDDDGQTPAQYDEDASQRAYRHACTVLDTPVVGSVLAGLATEEIRLGYHILSPRAVKACAVALCENGAVERLDLTGNRLGGGGGGGGILSVCAMLHENIFITDLSLADNSLGSSVRGLRRVAELVKTNESLRRVDLSSNQLADDGCAAIAEALAENVTLTELNLRDNGIGERGGRSLVQTLAAGNTSLESLDLSWNCLRNRGTEAIGEALATNIGLKQLKISWNGVHVRGCRALGRALETNTTLELLDLRDNRIDNEGLVLLLKGLLTNSTLNHLSLARNPFREQGLDSVLKFLESNQAVSLVHFDISGQELSKDQYRRMASIKSSRRSLEIVCGGSFQPAEMFLLQEQTMFLKENPLHVLLEYLRMCDLDVTGLLGSESKMPHREFKCTMMKAQAPLSSKMLDELVDILDRQNTGDIDTKYLMEKYSNHAAKTVLSQGENGQPELVTPRKDDDISRISYKLRTFLRIRDQFWTKKGGLKNVEIINGVK